MMKVFAFSDSLINYFTYLTNKILFLIYFSIKSNQLIYFLLINLLYSNHIVYPSYRDIIKNPMNFKKIKAKYFKKNNTEFSEFFQDLELIWNNCRTFNENGSDIYKTATEFEEFTQRFITTNFLNPQKNKNANYIVKKEKNSTKENSSNKKALSLLSQEIGKNIDNNNIANNKEANLKSKKKEKADDGIPIKAGKKQYKSTKAMLKLNTSKQCNLEDEKIKTDIESLESNYKSIDAFEETQEKIVSKEKLIIDKEDDKDTNINKNAKHPAIETNANDKAKSGDGKTESIAKAQNKRNNKDRNINFIAASEQKAENKDNIENRISGENKLLAKQPKDAEIESIKLHKKKSKKSLDNANQLQNEQKKYMKKWNQKPTYNNSMPKRTHPANTSYDSQELKKLGSTKKQGRRKIGSKSNNSFIGSCEKNASVNNFKNNSEIIRENPKHKLRKVISKLKETPMPEAGFINSKLEHKAKESEDDFNISKPMQENKEDLLWNKYIFFNK